MRFASIVRVSRYSVQCTKSTSNPVTALICFWNPRLLCQLYGDLKSGAIDRTVWAGSLTVPEKISSVVKPLLGFVMKSGRYGKLTNWADTSWLYNCGLKVTFDTGEAK